MAEQTTSGGSSAAIVAVLVIFVLIALFMLFTFGNRFMNSGPAVPDKVDVNIQSPGTK
jgi:hypothetical protein